MTDIIERVAEKIMEAVLVQSGDDCARFEGVEVAYLDQGATDFAPVATAALEELAKGLVWAGNTLEYNGVWIIHYAAKEEQKIGLENSARKQLFGLGPKEE